MLVGFIDSGGVVETVCYVAVVGIAVAEFDRVRICTVGHDTLAKIEVEGRNGTAIFKGILESL